MPTTDRPLADVVPEVTAVLADEVPALVTVLVSPVSTSVSLITTLPVAVTTPSSETDAVFATATGPSLVPVMVMVRVDQLVPEAPLVTLYRKVSVRVDPKANALTVALVLSAV